MVGKVCEFTIILKIKKPKPKKRNEYQTFAVNSRCKGNVINKIDLEAFNVSQKHSITQVTQKARRTKRLLKSIIITHFVTKCFKKILSNKTFNFSMSPVGARKKNAKTFTDSILTVKKSFYT